MYSFRMYYNVSKHLIQQYKIQQKNENNNKVAKLTIDTFSITEL